MAAPPSAADPEVPKIVPKRVATTAITGFQAGHGFFQSGFGSGNMNDTSSFLNGTQCASLTTDGAGGGNFLKHNTITPVIDMTNKMIRVWIRLPNQADIAHLSSVALYVGSDNIVANYYGFSDSLYSGFNADYFGNDYGAPLSDWQAITMSFGETVVTGAPVISSIQAIWLKVIDDNTGHPITVQFGGIELVPTPTKGTVSFTFDDSRATHYTQARTKLSQYRFPGTEYVICDVVDSALTLPGVTGPGYMTTQQLRELQDYHDWAICSHAYNVAHHNLPNGFNDLTAPALEADLSQTKMWLSQRGFNGRHHLALPKGKHNQTVYDFSREYFGSTRTTYSTSPTGAKPGNWLKHETYPPSDVNKLVVYYAYGTSALADMEAAVDSAVTNKEWLIFVFHDLVNTPDTVNYNDTQFGIANFGSLVDYVAGKGSAVDVRTVPDVIEHGM